MASTKAKGSSKNGRDSQSKRWGVKVFGGEIIKNGGIIIRQRGSKFYTGAGVRKSGDDTISADRDGTVVFQTKNVKSFTGKITNKTFVSVKSTASENEQMKKMVVSNIEAQAVPTSK